ncbi:MAG: hypothetical protein RBS01_03900 [Candidatus Dojkabacteria bacterium]|jgi:hypothetical protein|nr:hypothetical protein [Candidatus Dojkabacteria bacterium]
MIQITSLAYSTEEIPQGILRRAHLTPENQPKFKEQFLYLQGFLTTDFKLDCRVVEIVVDTYFVKIFISPKHNRKVDDFLLYKSNIRVFLSTPYLEFGIPTGKINVFYIEVPNFFTIDENIKDEISKLTLPDFIFLKIYTTIVSSKSLNSLYISEVLGISESRVKKYLRDMKKLNIISENGKFLEELDIYKGGYHLKRWKACSF